MDYEAKTISLSKLLVGSTGVVEPLCNFCKTRDCTNPIEKKKVSVFGVQREYLVYMRHGDPYGVVDCRGFVPRTSGPTNEK
jgi:hypothetical protein